LQKAKEDIEDIACPKIDVNYAKDIDGGFFPLILKKKLLNSHKDL